MELVATLEDLLYKAQVQPTEEGLRLTGWRILVHETGAVSVGIKDNSPGSVYSPPSYRQTESGEVFLIWADGKCSQAKVQPLASGKDAWQGELRQWREAAYEDSDAAFIPSPASLPLVAVEDRAVQKILSGNDERLFVDLNSWLGRKPAQAKLQGGIQASWGYKHIRTSKGLAVTYQQSQYFLWFWLDSLVGDGFGKRRVIRPEEHEGLWSRVLAYYEAMQAEGSPVTEKTVVVLAPSVTEDMLGHFILTNFAGEIVLNGQSAFSAERFRAREKVFAENLSLEVNPLRPFELGSYLVTSEGIPAERTVLISDGHLQTPYLRIKDARRWGAEPTAIPQGTSGLSLKHKQEEKWAEVLAGIEDGVLVLSVLGLHTQDSVAGQYSLSAPQSLRIKNGKITGRTAVKLTGNFFEDMAAPESVFASAPAENFPYLVLNTGVQNL